MVENLKWCTSIIKTSLALGNLYIKDVSNKIILLEDLLPKTIHNSASEFVAYLRDSIRRSVLQNTSILTTLMIASFLFVMFIITGIFT